MKKRFYIPVYWSMNKTVVVMADSKEEAVDLASETNLDDGDYSDGSFEIGYDHIEEQTQIFVFGSNLAGRHGLGAARRAHEEYGAILGTGVGLQGNSYAIPTKDRELKTLPLADIKRYVDDFIQFAIDNSELYFYVTKIGCGLAGYTEEEIAPLFEDCPINCELRFFKPEELI